MLDDYVCYGALFVPDPRRTLHASAGVIDLSCMAHARRKFFELNTANGSSTAHGALNRIASLYAIERQATQDNLNAMQRAVQRQFDAAPQLSE
jgi:transposase